ncbi:enoyl-ACP reductase FabI [Lactobacillus sp. Sy-1]|uniref:enoyl-ACP reductase FabI n=1 Tax=Lactobacillus sp. Sy-1 TaxID=2109645 RepID=UPI001C57EE37|nr:enoyl-ACP reductase FabI [Lactobacillus sp. Sy-1]MBW1605168.1 enoyl-ACP reductase FabI [Lactobacillus sp. Sy-1]
MAGILDGKKIVIMGVANKKSIAWGCAQALMDQGAEIILTYQNERMKRSLDKMLADVDVKMFECDVAEDANVEKTFNEIHNAVGNIDGLIHAIAFADKDTLEGGVKNVKKDGFNLAQDISAYSFISVSRYASAIMNRGGSITTLTYIGAVRAIPNYNMMGVAKAALEAEVRYLAAELGKESDIRVNAISAGAIKTLAVTGIKHHGDLLKMSEGFTVNGKSVTPMDVGKSAAFLMSDLASGVTGDIIYVDNGVHLIV